jgi:hypothetical protein
MFTHTHPIITRLALLATAALLAAGCASSEKARSAQPRKPLAVVDGTHQPGLTSEYRQVFREKLDELLFGKEGSYTKAENGATLRWEATRIDPGSRALRYFVGFGAGKGTFNARAVLVDTKGRTITSTSTEGDQVMGVAGGSFDSAIEEAAENIAEFANTNASSVQ